MLYTNFYEINVFDIADGYFINECGQIISTRWNHSPYRLMDLGCDSDGYLCKKLVCKDGKRRQFRINRLVCAVFNGEPSSSNLVAMHLDNNKQNNTPNNLKWGSISENTLDAYKDKLSSWSIKINSFDFNGNLLEFYSKQDFGRYIGCSSGYAGQLLHKIMENPNYYSKKYPKANGLQILYYSK